MLLSDIVENFTETILHVDYCSIPELPCCYRVCVVCNIAFVCLRQNKPLVIHVHVFMALSFFLTWQLSGG